MKSIKGIQSFVEEICKITRSKLNCQRLQYEIHFVLCSCKIESSERKKIARKHRYNSSEYCEMEPLIYIFALNSSFSVKSSFDGKQYVSKTCQLIQTFSINRV